MKRTKLTYWVVTLLFAAFMLLDGIGGILRVEAGQESLRHLGYPVYLLTIMGVAKILGVIAILQGRSRTLKEWAYAGFSINFIGAAASLAFVGDAVGLVVFPLFVLGFMLVSYFSWKKLIGSTGPSTRQHSTDHKNVASWQQKFS